VENAGQLSYLMNVIWMFLGPTRLGDPKPLVKLAHCRRILPRLPNIRRELCTRRPIIRKQVLQMLAHRRKLVCVSQRPIRTLENFLHLALHSIIHLGSMRVPIRTEEGRIGRGAGGGSFDEEEGDTEDCADDEHEFSDRQHRGPRRRFARGVGRRGGRHRVSRGRAIGGETRAWGLLARSAWVAKCGGSVALVEGESPSCRDGERRRCAPEDPRPWRLGEPISSTRLRDGAPPKRFNQICRRDAKQIRNRAVWGMVDSLARCCK
jgi:hypothetical protein